MVEIKRGFSENPLYDKGFLQYKELPETIRVSGGSPYFPLACKVLELLEERDFVDMSCIGASPNWQATLALSIIERYNPKSIKKDTIYCICETDRHPTKLVVYRITKQGSLVHFGFKREISSSEDKKVDPIDSV